MKPTKEGLTKILSITSLSDFDRVRGQFQKLKYEGYTLTLDVANLIEKRTKELFNGKTKSNFLIENIDSESKNQQRVDELEKQLAEMKEMLMQALQNKENTNKSAILSNDVENNSVPFPKELQKKKPGRPKTTSV